MDDNKVVIKIKYKPKSALVKKAGTQPIMITEWNIKRIIIALFVFLIVGGGMIFWMMDAGKSKKDILNHQQQVDKTINNIDNNEKARINNLQIDPKKEKPDLDVTIQGASEDTDKDNKPKIYVGNKSDSIVEADPDVTIQETGKDNKSDSNDIKQMEQPVLSQHVVRALITKAVNNKEPEGAISLPIIVSEDKAVGVYYFTELKDMKGKSVFHEWIFNGRTVFKRQIKISGKRWRASTSKFMSHKVLGDWSVRLIDNKGKVMNEIRFRVTGA